MECAQIKICTFYVQILPQQFQCAPLFSLCTLTQLWVMQSQTWRASHQIFESFQLGHYRSARLMTQGPNTLFTIVSIFPMNDCQYPKLLKEIEQAKTKQNWPTTYGTDQRRCKCFYIYQFIFFPSFQVYTGKLHFTKDKGLSYGTWSLLTLPFKSNFITKLLRSNSLSNDSLCSRRGISLRKL